MMVVRKFDKLLRLLPGLQDASLQLICWSVRMLYLELHETKSYNTKSQMFGEFLLRVLPDVDRSLVNLPSSDVHASARCLSLEGMSNSEKSIAHPMHGV